MALTLAVQPAIEHQGGIESGTPFAQIRADRAAKVARWRLLLEDGVYPTRAALARGEGVSRAAVTRALGRGD